MVEYEPAAFYVRWRAGEDRLVPARTLTFPHPMIGRACAMCGQPFGHGSEVTGFVVAADRDRDGRWHAAPALALHAGCLLAPTPEEVAGVVEWARPLRGCAPSESADSGPLVADDAPERGRPFLAAP